MARKFVDLSVALETGIASDPPIMAPEIEYMRHDQTAEQVMAFFPGLRREDLPGGEGWSWDTPFPLTAREYVKNGDASIIWDGHRASMEIGYCHMEKLTHLESLPSAGFEISCFPYKIKGASAGFIRAVAIFEE